MALARPLFSPPGELSPLCAGGGGSRRSLGSLWNRRDHSARWEISARSSIAERAGFSGGDCWLSRNHGALHALERPRRHPFRRCGRDLGSAAAACASAESLLGRVIDGMGEPLDFARAACRLRSLQTLDAPRRLPLERELIREAIGCGIRAIDGFLTCGRGQRVGIFGGSGVGKSTLIGMMARNTSADLTVLALVGERGREVRHFLEDALGEEGRKRSVVVVSTSDQSPLLRIRARPGGHRRSPNIFAAQGKNVLLVVDSLTRLAMAQREISLAAGEPPTAKGYTPSVFTHAGPADRAGGKISHVAALPLSTPC